MLLDTIKEGQRLNVIDLENFKISDKISLSKSVNWFKNGSIDKIINEIHNLNALINQNYPNTEHTTAYYKFNINERRAKSSTNISITTFPNGEMFFKVGVHTEKHDQWIFFKNEKAALTFFITDIIQQCVLYPNVIEYSFLIKSLSNIMIDL